MSPTTQLARFRAPEGVGSVGSVRAALARRLRRRDPFVTSKHLNGPRLVRVRLWWRTRRTGSLLQAPLRITGPGAAHALELISIAPGTRIGQFSWFSLVSRDARVRIGSGCTLSASMSISVKTSVEIADGTAIGERALITDHGHDHMTYLEPAIDGEAEAPQFGWGITEGRPVVIGPGVHIGANVFIGPGVTVGEGAVIGVNSVVTKSVRPYTIVAGVPAREIRSLRPEDR